MDMICHQYIGVNVATTIRGGVSQARLVQVIVRTVEKHRLSIDATLDHVLGYTFDEVSGLSRHMQESRAGTPIT